MVWVLITSVFYFNGNGAGVGGISAEFGSESACIFAATSIRDAHNWSSSQFKYVCVPKG